jgi:DNA ligase (NAD+)
MIHMDTVLSLVKRLKKADKAYFESGSPVMSDKRYDRLKDKLQQQVDAMARSTGSADKKLLAKANKYLGTIGHSPTKAKVRLELPMPSLSKVKNDDDKALDRFIRKLKDAGEKNILQSPKLDGSSLLLNYKVDGDCAILHSARTRGDGTIGRDVTAHAKLLARCLIIPLKVRTSSSLDRGYKMISVRGELLMSKRKFTKKWEGKKVDGTILKEGRNAVNGFVNSKTLNTEFARDLTFIAFGLYADGKEILSRSKTVSLLHKSAFTTYVSSQVGDYYPLAKLTGKRLRKSLTMLSGELYTCDGLVLEADTVKVRRKLLGRNKPEHSIAYKVGHTDLEGQEVHTTTVTKVEWNTSKTGALIPLIHYEPVKFGLTTNSKANGISLKNLRSMKMGPGAKIKVIRSGGVIPRIVKVVKPHAVKIPTKCECGAPTVEVGVHLYCGKPHSCSILAKEQLTSALKHLKVDGYGGTKVQQVYDAGYTNITLLLAKGREKQLLKIPRWGEKAASTARTNLLKSLEKAKASDLMVVSGRFVEPGFSLASSRCQIVVKALGPSPEKWRVKDAQKLAKVKGFGTVASECFARCLPTYQKWYKEFRSAQEAVARKGR